MINQNERQFAIYVITQLFPTLSQAFGDQTAFVQKLSTSLPGVQSSDLKGQGTGPWAQKVASSIVDYYADTFDASKMKASA